MAANTSKRLLDNPSAHTLYMREYLRLHPEKRRDQAVVAERKRQRKVELVRLKGGVCMDCGYTGHPAAFEFDHRDPSTKVAHVSWLTACKWERVLAEVEKCDLVCSNCHRIRTFVRGQYSHPRKTDAL